MTVSVTLLSDAFQAMKPGQPHRLEFEYERHGTLSLIANWHVSLGKVIASSIGPTRKKIDFANHIRRRRPIPTDKSRFVPLRSISKPEFRSRQQFQTLKPRRKISVRKIIVFKI